MGGLELRLGGVDLRLGGLQRLRCLIVVDARGPALLEQRVLALEVVAGLRQLALGSHEIGLRGSQGIELVLRLEAGHELSRLHLVPHLQAVLQQPAGDAEGQGHLVLGLDATSKDDGQAGGALVDRQGANGTGVLGDLLRFLAAPRQQGCGQG